MIFEASSWFKLQFDLLLFTMKEWITRQDGLEKLELVDTPEPSDLNDGDVLVKINCVSLNYRDTEGSSLGLVLYLRTKCSLLLTSMLWYLWIPSQR